VDALSDDELVARCKAELPYNVNAYRELLRRHEPLVYRSCLKMLGSVQDAEEACQDSFLQVFHKISQFEGRSAFKTWLYRIVYNRCIETRRKDARRNQYHAKLKEEVENEELANSNTDSHNEITGRVHEVIAKMNGEERRLVTLRYISGLSIQEISDVLEIGLSATKMRLYRAQERFKEIYNDLDFEGEVQEG
jgi:RNA polymerase sigma-70 factor (ECF subfamily)|tara:strand:- start:4576 stop:5154 length:579 start_codon:yes stop_codon:yes gene_type:complete